MDSKKFWDTIYLNAIRTSKGLPSPRIIDLLLLFSEFEKSIKDIRKKYQITPKSIESELKLLLKESYELYRSGESIIDKAEKEGLIDKEGKLRISLEKHGKLQDIVAKWEKHRFPTVNKDISILRLKVFGKIPRSWTEPIKDYLLYNKRSISYADNEKPNPEISFKQDDETSEQYLDIKIYGDSNLSLLTNKKLLKNLQKKLPTYFHLEKGAEENLERRAFYYLLRNKFKLKPQKASDKLEELLYEPIDYEHDSQELKARFTSLFFSKTNPLYKKRVKAQKNNT